VTPTSNPLLFDDRTYLPQSLLSNPQTFCSSPSTFKPRLSSPSIKGFILKARPIFRDPFSPSPHGRSDCIFFFIHPPPPHHLGRHSIFFPRPRLRANVVVYRRSPRGRLLGISFFFPSIPALLLSRGNPSPPSTSLVSLPPVQNSAALGSDEQFRGFLLEITLLVLPFPALECSPPPSGRSPKPLLLFGRKDVRLSDALRSVPLLFLFLPCTPRIPLSPSFTSSFPRRHSFYTPADFLPNSPELVRPPLVVSLFLFSVTTGFLGISFLRT